MAHQNDTLQSVVALDRAKSATPGGSQTASRQHGLIGPFAYPAFAQSATGAYITFDDGGVAIDLAGANATVPLGYNHPDIVRALQRQLGSGGSLSLPSYLEAEASERLISLLPFPALVRWVRTGSEAVSAAVAIAQDTTKRRKIGTFPKAYHGWHPWTREVEQLNEHPPFLPRYTAHHLAAVIVESPRWTLVDADYVKRLTALRTECDKAGVLLVYDDVVYGFRYHSAGLQGSTGVAPDIACFSKALGNGVPVACIAGEPALMNQSMFVVSSTFGGEMLGLAAANTVLHLHQEADICGELLRIGVRLRAELVKAVADTPISIVGTPQHFKFVAEAPYLDKFLELCVGTESDTLQIDQGAERVLIHRDANNVNLAMTKAVQKEIVHTVKLAARQVKAEHSKDNNEWQK